MYFNLPEHRAGLWNSGQQQHKFKFIRFSFWRILKRAFSLLTLVFKFITLFLFYYSQMNTHEDEYAVYNWNKSSWLRLYSLLCQGIVNHQVCQKLNGWLALQSRLLKNRGFMHMKQKTVTSLNLDFDIAQKSYENDGVIAWLSIFKWELGLCQV